MDAERKEIVTRKIVWYLPSPAPWGEVCKAVTAARRVWEELHGERECTWDNVPMIESCDDEVWIWIEVSEETSFQGR